MTKPQKRAFFVVVTVITIAALVWIEFDTHLIYLFQKPVIYDERGRSS